MTGVKTKTKRKNLKNDYYPGFNIILDVSFKVG